MAAKIFEVGDVLPATTQLKISWLKSLETTGTFNIKTSTGYYFIRYSIENEVNDKISINNNNIYTYGEGFISPYTDFGGAHAYIVIDISTMSLNARTISSIDTDMDIFAWEDLNAPSGFNVTFEENGGSTVTDLTEQTNLPNPLPIPTKSGYTFNGWFYESNFTTQAQASDVLSANVTLYAKWTLNTYSITYEENGGTSVTDLTEQTALPSPLPTTTKANHVFAGWYYDNLFTQKANAGDELTTNVTLYAKWYTPTTWCEDIANAIREKEGSSEPIKHVDFADKIKNIQGAKPEETKTVTPNFSSGNVVVTPTSGKVLSQVTIQKDANFIAENLKKDVTAFGLTGTLESGGVPLEQFISFSTDYSGGLYGDRLLTFLSRNPFGRGTPVDIKIYYKNGSEDVLLISERVNFDTVNFIVIPRSYGNLKIVMSLVPDAYYEWGGFSGFYAKTAQPNVVTQLTAPSFQDDFVLSYIDFDVFHVVFTAYGD